MNDQRVVVDGRGLADALADLASTVPDNPYRLAGIEHSVARLRRRRRAVRAGGLGVVAAMSVAGFVVVRASSSTVVTSSAATPPAAGAVPVCSALIQPAAVASASNAVRSLGGNGPPAVGQSFKALAKITAFSDTSIAVAVQNAAPGDPTTLTLSITPATTFMNGGQPVARPALHTGQLAAFGATRLDATKYRLDALDIGGGAAPVPGSRKRDAVVTGPATPANEVNGKGTVTGSATQSVVVAVVGGPLDGRTVTFSTDPFTRFFVGGQQCTPGVLTGRSIGFAAHPSPRGAYVLDEAVLG